MMILLYKLLLNYHDIARLNIQVIILHSVCRVGISNLYVHVWLNITAGHTRPSFSIAPRIDQVLINTKVVCASIRTFFYV